MNHKCLYLWLFLVALSACTKWPQRSDKQQRSSAQESIAASQSLELRTRCLDNDQTGTICPNTLDTSLSITLEKLEAVSQNYFPGTLALEQANSQITTEIKLPIENPCLENGRANLGECLHDLLKIYINVGKSPLDIITSTFAHVRPLILEKLQEGIKSGVIISQERDSIERIDFKLETASTFVIRIADDQIASQIAVDNGRNINFKIKFLHTDESQNAAKFGEVSISFTDESSWQVMNQLVFDPCHPQSGAIGAIATAMQYKLGIWQGKAVVSSKDAAPCKAGKPERQLGWYTDFVGNDQMTSASVYFLPEEFQPYSVKNLEKYNAAKLCSNMPNHPFCKPQPLNSLARSHFANLNNPFCVEAEFKPIWGRACHSNNSLIDNATYSDPSLWQNLHAALQRPSYCFPKSIAQSLDCEDLP